MPVELPTRNKRLEIRSFNLGFSSCVNSFPFTVWLVYWDVTEGSKKFPLFFCFIFFSYFSRRWINLNQQHHRSARLFHFPSISGPFSLIIFLILYSVSQINNIGLILLAIWRYCKSNSWKKLFQRSMSLILPFLIHP